MAPFVAILTLLAAAPGRFPSTAEPPFQLDSVSSIERLRLPALKRRPTLDVDASSATVRLEVAPAEVARVAAALRATSRIACPSLTEEPAAVVLRCRTHLVSAAISGPRQAETLDLRELRVLPWDGRARPPRVALDPAELGMGAPCPGSTPAGRGECAFARGADDKALAAFRAALGTPEASLAELRLGDLELEANRPAEAVRHWQAARAHPVVGRLAGSRLCELDPDCFGSPIMQDFQRSDGLPSSAHADVLLRGARLRAILGDPLGAARQLSPEIVDAHGACRRSPAFCRETLLSALRLPLPAGSEALSLWMELPDRRHGPLALDLARAAAERAADSGAPVFGASVLGSISEQVPAAQLPAHLLRQAELYLQGNDRARASVVVEFVRAHNKGKLHPDPRWAKVVEGIEQRPGVLPTQLRDPAAGVAPELATAAATASKARALKLNGDRR
ncbi:hypothetical protein [Anaeromyxobacter paludicola]|uniref:hypothetical protein n=1 Tax=Anaeromyxobacter paludicola TaxID=2918171 RepID=UPI0020BD9526|nr:hypothetical protein [Anaeromyxobacter paludicola]